MMSQIAKDLQALAHDLSCTIVCLSQLPNHAGREDTGILEFKGAGEIAAACDVGVLMKRAKEDKTKILFDVRKNRHGKCGKYLLRFADGWTRIEELETVE
jgi:replicative DNA helicase